MNEADLRNKGWIKNPDGSMSKQIMRPPPESKGIGMYELAKEHKSKRIRQSSKPLLNKLEARFKEQLDKIYGQFGFPVLCQAIRFRLANGLWYKPDFIVFCERGFMAFEVKGPHAFRGGFENLKMAASVYSCPIFKWWLVWEDEKEESTGWQWQEVKP